MNTYKSFDTQLGKRDSRKIGNNTYLKRRADTEIAIMLHATDVVTYKQSGEVVLNSGGWHTVTTKDRISEYIPNSYQVGQEKGIWYVRKKCNFRKEYCEWSDSEEPTYDWECLSEFYDGMILKGGRVIKPRKPEKTIFNNLN